MYISVGLNMSSQWRIRLHEGANSLQARERKPLWGLGAEPPPFTSWVDGAKPLLVGLWAKPQKLSGFSTNSAPNVISDGLRHSILLVKIAPIAPSIWIHNCE